MSERKMALPPLKISEPYRLVWGLLCLKAGIILFASYPNLWLTIFTGFVLVLVGVIYCYAGFFYWQKDWGLAGLAIGLLWLESCVQLFIITAIATQFCYL